MRWFAAFVSASALLVGCSSVVEKKAVITSVEYPEAVESSRVVAGSAVSAKTHFLLKLKSADEFKDLSEASTGVIRQGETIKLLIDNRKSEKPAVYFMNSNYCPKSACATPAREAIFHYDFAKAVIKGFALSETDYFNTAYYSTKVSDRKFFDARIQRFKITEGGQTEEYYGVRFIERDAINEELIRHAISAISKVIAIPQAKLAFIANAETQNTPTLQPWLEQNHVKFFTMETILSGIDFIGLNPGTAYGYLRVFPKNEEDLEPFDIPVFASLPLDLSVVAGTISTEYQDVGSHVNLKSKERGTPNMVIRKSSQIEQLKSLDGKPVRLVVTFTGYKLEVTTEQKVREEYEKKISKPWQIVKQDEESRLMFFDDMCANGRAPSRCLQRSRAYGGKTAGMGFLASKDVAGVGSPLQKKFGYRLTPMGYGVPLTVYNKFMALNLAKNPALKELYTKLIDSEMGLNKAAPLTAQERNELVRALKLEILKGDLPPEEYAAIYQKMLALRTNVDAFYAGASLEKLKLRSSSNAEDIEGFNGAGLHDSYSARISLSKPEDFSGTNCSFVLGTDDDTGLTEEDVEPKSLACAMKAAYASLWNTRAVRERSYKRFDHRSASMGLSVQTAYKFRKGPKIKANSVLITRVLGTESVYGQQISTQVKNGLVTNPVPNTKAELAVLSFDASGKGFGVNVLQYAKPFADQPALISKILSNEELLKISNIARAVEIKYCESKENYFPGGKCANVTNSQKKALALDMEFKQFDNGEILIKQVRTFSGR
jgi:Pyruvate phosphate dikinase, AMP/ATP-binding domain